MCPSKGRREVFGQVQPDREKVTRVMRPVLLLRKLMGVEARSERDMQEGG